MQTQSGVERALIARGLNGTEVIIATDGPWLACDVESISDSNADVGLCELPNRPGLYLFTGTAELKTYMTLDGSSEPEVEWGGCVRPVRPEEVAELLAMAPPEEEESTDA